MFDKSELPDSIDDLAAFLLEAVTSCDEITDTETKYDATAQSLASVSAAAFSLASVLLGADSWQEAHAKSLFLVLTGTPEDDFRVVYGDDILVPGAVENTFSALDEWYNHLEKTVAPQRARDLLHAFGDEVNTETRALWEALSSREKKGK